MTFLDLSALAIRFASDMGFTPYDLFYLALTLRRDQLRHVPGDVCPGHGLDQAQKRGVDRARRDGIDDRS